jgi:murein peptide amidase A
MRTFLYSYDELPKMFRFLCLFLFIVSLQAHSEPISLRQTCINSLKVYKSYFKDEALQQICDQVEKKEICSSTNGEPIYHLDRKSKLEHPKKILVMSLIHGDETPAGSLGRFWMERLMKVDARNTWRVIPVVNPDGVKKKTRTNEKGVDLNRNFPTADWSADAIKLWEKKEQKSERKFPGFEAGAEPEVKCIIQHLEEFKPDFVISIHTPLKVLDFDGPKLKNPPKYSYLPWKSLGNFPGSLGRYLWVERNTPVLTTELKSTLPENDLPFEQLQDLIGTLVKTDLN